MNRKLSATMKNARNQFDTTAVYSMAMRSPGMGAIALCLGVRFF
jgi:hypothetical protein